MDVTSHFPMSYKRVLSNLFRILRKIKCLNKIYNENCFHLGAWFLQPLKIQNRPLPKSDDEQYLSTQNHLIDENDTIILYLHGNAETRSQYHRRELYRLFQKMGFYVLAIDYRCYADSSKLLRPSQTSMVEDAQTAYDWILSKSHTHVNIFVWGHR